MTAMLRSEGLFWIGRPWTGSVPVRPCYSVRLRFCMRPSVLLVLVPLWPAAHSLWCVVQGFHCACCCCCPGIGFKATAIISQATYIDSGGFNFLFDLRPESYPGAPDLRWLGLLRPTWVEHLSILMEAWIDKSLAGMAQENTLELLSKRLSVGSDSWQKLLQLRWCCMCAAAAVSCVIQLLGPGWAVESLCPQHQDSFQPAVVVGWEASAVGQTVCHTQYTV